MFFLLWNNSVRFDTIRFGYDTSGIAYIQLDIS